MDIINTLQHYWALLLGVIGIIGAWFRYEWKLTDLETKHKDSITRISALEKGTDDFREKIQIDIQEIKTNIVWIKENFNKNRKG